MRRQILLLLAAFSLTACVRAIEVSHSISPSRTFPDKSSEKAGVVCSDDLLTHVARAGYWKLELGEPLCGALLRSVQGTYRSAERTTKPPYAGEYGRVVRFDIQSSTFAIAHTRDGSHRVTCALSVVVERFGRDMKRLSSQAATGHAVVERDDSKELVIRDCAEAALQNVADDASALLVAGLDGPRQHGTSSGTPPPAAPAAPWWH
jgi:hypothetical protein